MITLELQLNGTSAANVAVKHVCDKCFSTSVTSDFLQVSFSFLFSLLAPLSTRLNWKDLQQGCHVFLMNLNGVTSPSDGASFPVILLARFSILLIL